MKKIIGKVNKGRGLGRYIGFPTLNIPYNDRERGVFVGKVGLNGKRYEAGVHLGNRPTFFDEDIVCEAFLLDFDEEIEEGVEVEIEVFEKIREIKKFEDLGELKTQICKDVEFIKKSNTG